MDSGFDTAQNPALESQRHEVSFWLHALAETGVVNEIDPSLVRTVLESYGANFDLESEAQDSLRQYTNKDKAPGLRMVWGSKFDDFKAWTLTYVEQYETPGKTLPALKPSGRKNSGMIQFFGELTSLAAGELSFEDFKRYTEARIRNGRLWEGGKKGERVKVKVPTSENPILLSSVPPGFVQAAWEQIST
ncbi:MAG: hypothetical protein HYS86_03550 [Candidatus Chisholmbacteria bacterium]|nr:hypothetical protein [Candidatus Chisholmbacteria bacterium]